MGDYVCNQGLTDMTLQIATTSSGLEALYVFYEAAANPGVPSGCFRMTGAYDPTTGALRFRAGSWIVHPTGYLTVDLDGVVDLAAGRYEGRVRGFNCTRFTLRRSDRAPVIDHPCFQGFS